MDDLKDVNDLDKIISAGDAWLRKYGVISPMMHNNLVLNLRTQFPKIKHLEYFMAPDPNQREIKLVVYVSLWTLIFNNANNLIDNIISVVEAYLYNFKVNVEIKRYKGES